TDEMLAAFHEWPQAVWNTSRVAEMCELSFTFGKPHLPQYRVPDGNTLETYLDTLAREGLTARLRERPSTIPEIRYQQRLRDQLRGGEVRQGLCLPDHYVRHDEGEGGHSRCGTGVGNAVRRSRPYRKARPRSIEHHLGRSPGSGTPAEGPCAKRSEGAHGLRDGPGAGELTAPCLDTRRGRRD